MQISKEEAKIILKLAENSWGEGLGSQNDKLLVQRIQENYPDLEIPSIVEFFLKDANVH